MKTRVTLQKEGSWCDGRELNTKLKKITKFRRILN